MSLFWLSAVLVNWHHQPEDFVDATTHLAPRRSASTGEADHG